MLFVICFSCSLRAALFLICPCVALHSEFPGFMSGLRVCSYLLAFVSPWPLALRETPLFDLEVYIVKVKGSRKMLQIVCPCMWQRD